MKYLKKCAAALAALAIVLSLAVGAAAAGTEGTITITGTTGGKVYEIYKIFDLTMAGESAVAYTIDPDWVSFFKGTGAGYITDTNSGSLNPITVDGAAKFINITEKNVDTFSQEALAYAVSLTADASRTAPEEGGTVVFDGLGLGYYLVYPQGASEIKEGMRCICSLTSTVPDAQVTVKAEYPTIEKTDDAVSADLGQTVTYTITGEVPDTTGYETYEYTIRDTMTEGLTFQEKVTVTFGTTPMEVQPDFDAVENGFLLTFDMTQFQAYKGQPITVTYSAVVNEKAIQPGTVEKNSATLTYDHDPSDNTQKTTNPPVEEEVYSSRIVIDKMDGKTKVKLSGAEFVLMNQQGQFYKLDGSEVTWVETEEAATTMTTDDSGAATFDGLKNGIYHLKETKAPDGYNLLTETIEVDVNSEEESDVSVSITAPVENLSGTTLPSTGGMGTTVFYALGSILLLGAAVLLITKKRMSVM